MTDPDPRSSHQPIAANRYPDPRGCSPSESDPANDFLQHQPTQIPDPAISLATSANPDPVDPAISLPLNPILQDQAISDTNPDPS